MTDIVIIGPDGSRNTFPQGTPDEAIQKAMAAQFPAIAPGSGSAVYGDTGAPITAGQEATLQAQGGLNAATPVGSATNPRFQSPSGPAPDAGVFIDPFGKTVQHDARPLSETMLATAGRFGVRTLGAPLAAMPGGWPMINGVARGMFPSGANDAFESGATSGLLLGGKNELAATGDALAGMSQGQPFGASFKSGLDRRDAQDRILRENHPLAYYGGGILGTGAGAAVTPEVAGAGRVGQVALDALQGAAGGFLSTDGSLKQRGVGAALGAALAGGGRLVASRKPVVKAPRKPSNQEILAGEGVRLTPGQAMGPVGRGMEAPLTSVPILGGGIKKAETRAIEDLNRAAINRALAPIGETLPKGMKVGHEAVAHAEDAISAVYDRNLGNVGPMVADQAFTTEMQAAKAAIDELPGDLAAGLRNILKNRIEDRMATGALDGRAWKQIDSELSHKVRSYNKSLDPLNHEGADVLVGLRQTMRDLLERHASPEALSGIRNANEAFANLVRVQRAARRADDGVFTPNQLKSAVLAEDASSRGRASSRNEALMQDLANAGSAVLKPYPDSGTAGRMLPYVMGIGAVGAPHAAIPTAVGLTGGRLAYSSGAASGVATGAIKMGAEARAAMANIPRLTPEQRAMIARHNARASGQVGGILSGN